MAIRKSVPCRCSRCNKRRTLAKHPDLYLREPKCRACGFRLYICKDRLPSRHGWKHKCNYGGWWFPHRKGSGFCWENPRAEQLRMERHPMAEKAAESHNFEEDRRE